MTEDDATNNIWETMRTASAVRRYRDEPVDDEVLERCLRAATWAPSGGNQQPWRFVVVRSPETRAVITDGAHATWTSMTSFYGLEVPAESDDSSRARVVRAMYEHMQAGGAAPVCVLFCVKPQPGASDLQQGGSIFPAVQNFLLAARALGLGAAVTLWHGECESDLRSAVAIPDDWRIATLITAGWPKGSHKPVRRKDVSDVVAVDEWDHAWSV